MRVRHRGWGAAVVAVALTLAACGDDEPEDPFAATTTAPILLGDDAVSTTTTATTTPPTAPPLGPDPFAVPATAEAITETYVEAVLNELARLDGDALRMVTTEGIITMEALAIVEEVFTPEQVPVQVDELNQIVGIAGGAPPSPGDRRYAVTDLLRASTDCIAAATEVDFTDVAPGAPAGQPLVVQLVRKPTVAGEFLNRTVWQIDFEFVPEASEGLPLCDG